MNTNVAPASTPSRRVVSTVVVGVDGSSRNRAAVAWARHEAGQVGSRLVLVGASHEYAPPTPGFSADYADDLFMEDARKTLESVRADLGGTDEDMPIWVARGGAQSALLRAAERADLVVVGRRGKGAVKRMFVGSNSIGVAGRSPVPVVVVPDGWEAPGTSTAPVVVGVDRSGKDEDALAYAFDRAYRIGVPLLVVHAWQIPALYTWSAEDLSGWRDEIAEEFKQTLRPWKSRYPSVETVVLTPDANAALAIADAAAIAQLIVLGRHTGPRHLGGFHLGSTTRSILHHAQCPVAVIPSSSPHPEPEDDDILENFPEFAALY